MIESNFTIIYCPAHLEQIKQPLLSLTLLCQVNVPAALSRETPARKGRQRRHQVLDLVSGSGATLPKL